MIEAVLEDLKKHGTQSSWDWEADQRFASHIGDSEAADGIRKILDSCAPSAFRIAAMLEYRRITNRRLRVLRKLVKNGLVVAFWDGLGQGAINQFGVRRVRCFRIHV